MSWVKIRINLETDPRLLKLSRDVGLSADESLVILYRLAGWFDTSGDYGIMRTTPQTVDAFLRIKGVYASLYSVGWISSINGIIRLNWFTDVSGKRKGIGRKLRALVLSSGVCNKCKSRGPLEVDHIIPVKRGGKTELKNLQPLCVKCNRTKGSS
jgi:hypothetical protein